MAEMTIKRVGVFSIAKIQALLMFVIGLIIGVIYGLVFMFFGAAIAAMAPNSDQTLGGIGSVVGGLVIMVLFPIFYGILGFIGGVIGGLVYNLAAGIVGGIKIDLEGVAPDYAPPQPQQWGSNPA